MDVLAFFLSTIFDIFAGRDDGEGAGLSTSHCGPLMFGVRGVEGMPEWAGGSEEYGRTGEFDDSSLPSRAAGLSDESGGWLGAEDESGRISVAELGSSRVSSICSLNCTP